MSKIISNQNGGKPVYYGNKSNENISRFSQAPLYLPKYSINTALKERDIFRKQAEYNLRESKNTNENSNLFKKLMLFGSAIAAFIVLEKRKII